MFAVFGDAFVEQYLFEVTPQKNGNSIYDFDKYPQEPLILSLFQGLKPDVRGKTRGVSF